MKDLNRLLEIIADIAAGRYSSDVMDLTGPERQILDLLADPEAALTCYRALVRAAGVDTAMRRCADCLAFDSNTGVCRQAAQGADFGPGVALSRSYRPDPLQTVRCAAFLPLPNDPDQRTGAERWPFLVSRNP